MIRPFERDDAAAIVSLLQELEPQWITTLDGFLHSLDTEPKRAQRSDWVAAEGGELVGWGTAELNWAVERDDLGGLWLGVREGSRRCGVGARLYDAGAAHLAELGAGTIESWVDGDLGRRFLGARGFAPDRTERTWALDPRTVDLDGLAGLELERVRDGFRVVTLADLRDRIDDVYPLWAEAVADIPADEPETNISLDEWRHGELSKPDLSWEGSVVVLHDERPVALSWINADPQTGRAEHELTGTLRAFRRRGLARLAKLATIRWAVEHGITAMQTGNDSANADMLALNEHLGYRPMAPYTRMVKQGV